MEITIPATVVSEFSDQLERATGININVCFQCRKCTSGCPLAYAMDFTPPQLLHAARLGLRDAVLGSKTIWLCASCETCVTRCPQDVDIVKVMDSLKSLAIRTGIEPAVPEVAYFYRSSIRSILAFGRVYELGLIGQLKLGTRKFRKDLGLGLKMLRKRKLPLLPDLSAIGRNWGLLSKVQKWERR